MPKYNELVSGFQNAPSDANDHATRLRTGTNYMTNNENNLKKVAVVAGAGAGLGIALCQKLVSEGYAVAGLSRSAEPQPQLGNQYLAIACDITDALSVETAMTEVEKSFGNISVYIHNAAYLVHTPFLEMTEADISDIWKVSCIGAMHGIQRVLPNMLTVKSGTILVSGATASIKASAEFSAFASAKFALRGLTQSLAREFGSQGIHIAHIILDGAIWGWQAEHKFGRDQHDCLQPDAIADNYFHLINQHRSVWTQELDMRPDMKLFSG